MTHLVRFDGVGKVYRRGRERINLRAAMPGRLGEMRGGDQHWALHDLSFELPAGGSIGFVGPNGAGKSTTLKLVAGVIAPSRGSVEVLGRTASLIELGAGFHPDMTGRENVYFSAAVLGMSSKVLGQRFDQIVDFADIGGYLDSPVKRYSSGMLARLGFAVASHLDAEVLVLDEVLAVGDATFQRRCHQRIQQLRAEGAALLYVTHALWTLPMLCERGVLLADGVVRASGSPSEVLAAYEQLHAAGVIQAAPDAAQVFRRVRTSATAIDPGGWFEVEVDVEPPGPCPHGHVLVVVTDLDQKVCTSVSSAGVVSFADPRRQTVRCRLEELPIQPGPYQVHVGFVGDSALPAVDEVRIFELHVRGEVRDIAYGAVRVPTTWSTVAGEPPSPP
ncbi:MAG: polysaccharide ABC transporter ATP-binding protein, partial [Acidimicrobiales bacterium]